MSTIFKWISRILIGLIALLFIIFIVAAVMPVAADPLVGENHGAGASSIEPSYSGLQREFPATNEPEDNASSTAKVELGRLLFFDPVLSENNDIACATCHQPDLGFSDGKIKAVGPGGTELARNTPTLWNVTYAQNLFWDGRLHSLRSPSRTPPYPSRRNGLSPAPMLSLMSWLPSLNIPLCLVTLLPMA